MSGFGKVGDEIMAVHQDFGLFRIASAFSYWISGIARRCSTHCGEFVSGFSQCRFLEGSIPSPLFQEVAK